MTFYKFVWFWSKISIYPHSTVYSKAQHVYLWSPNKRRETTQFCGGPLVMLRWINQRHYVGIMLTPFFIWKDPVFLSSSRLIVVVNSVSWIPLPIQPSYLVSNVHKYKIHIIFDYRAEYFGYVYVFVLSFSSEFSFG